VESPVEFPTVKDWTPEMTDVLRKLRDLETKLGKYVHMNDLESLSEELESLKKRVAGQGESIQTLNIAVTANSNEIDSIHSHIANIEQFGDHLDKHKVDMPAVIQYISSLDLNRPVILETSKKEEPVVIPIVEVKPNNSNIKEEEILKLIQSVQIRFDKVCKELRRDVDDKLNVKVFEEFRQNNEKTMGAIEDRLGLKADKEWVKKMLSKLNMLIKELEMQPKSPQVEVAMLTKKAIAMKCGSCDNIVTHMRTTKSDYIDWNKIEPLEQSKLKNKLS